jgi:hypothetical protein
LDNGHDKVDGGARVVRRELSDEIVKCRRGWANAEKQRNLNEQDDEGADTVLIVSRVQQLKQFAHGEVTMTDRQMTLKMITKLRLKMFAIPKAKHSTMQTTPVLEIVSLLSDIEDHG